MDDSLDVEARELVLVNKTNARGALGAVIGGSPLTLTFDSSGYRDLVIKLMTRLDAADERATVRDTAVVYRITAPEGTLARL